MLRCRVEARTPAGIRHGGSSGLVLVHVRAPERLHRRRSTEGLTRTHTHARPSWGADDTRSPGPLPTGDGGPAAAPPGFLPGGGHEARPPLTATALPRHVPS